MELAFEFTVDDVVKEGKITREEIQELKKWSEVEEDVPNFKEEQLLLFLLACDRDLEFAKKTIREYLRAKRNGHNLFKSRDVEREDVKSQLEALEYSVLPRRTQDGCAIIFHRLYDTKISSYCMEPAMKAYIMTVDSALRKYPPNGLIILFDMKGVSFWHLTRIRIGLIKQFFHYLQEGLPVKLKIIHVLNTVYFLDKILAIIKPFIKKEIYDMLNFHPIGMNMEDFHEKYIPKSCLPEDYGGELPCTRILNEINTERLRKLKSYFEAEENQW